jgi:hypothetical protein
MARPHEIIKNFHCWGLYDAAGITRELFRTREGAVQARLERLATIQAEMKRLAKVEFDILYTTAEDKTA